MAWRRITHEEIRAIYRQGEEAVIALVDQLQDVIILLEKRVEELEARVQKLESQLAQNSRNSNRPPSSEGLSKPPPKNLRPATDRSPGGQPGHSGQTLTQVKNPDRIIKHRVGSCPCGAKASVLKKEPPIDWVVRQVFELPPMRLEVSEHRAEVKACPCCGRILRGEFPAGVNAPAQYGPGFEGLLVYLHGQQLLPAERTGQLCEDLFGQPVSAATVLSAVGRAHRNLEGFEAQVAAQLRKEPVIHVDESGLRVAGRLHWLHVIGTQEWTLYGVHRSRGLEAMEAMGVLPHFEGWMVHDFWKPYFAFDCLHALCNEHLLRELKFLAEEGAEKWAAKLSRFLCRTYRRKKAQGPLRGRKAERLLESYYRILEEGRKRHPRREAGQGRSAQSKAANLLDRLEDFEPCILAFSSEPEVPFTNNQAERDLRMNKVKQKISGCFRTLKGAQIFARVRSYLSTCRKQGKNLWTALQQAVQGQPWMPFAPAQGP
jgi:transposase